MQSTSSVFRDFLSIIHGNEVLWSDHCTILCMRSSYSGEFKSDERASEPSVHFCNRVVPIDDSIVYGLIVRDVEDSKCLCRYKFKEEQTKSNCLFTFCFKNILMLSVYIICLYNECVIGLCFIGCFLPSSHPLHSHFFTIWHAHFWSLFQI